MPAAKKTTAKKKPAGTTIVGWLGVDTNGNRSPSGFTGTFFKTKPEIEKWLSQKLDENINDYGYGDATEALDNEELCVFKVRANGKIECANVNAERVITKVTIS